MRFKVTSPWEETWEVFVSKASVSEEVKLTWGFWWTYMLGIYKCRIEPCIGWLGIIQHIDSLLIFFGLQLTITVTRNSAWESISIEYYIRPLKILVYLRTFIKLGKCLFCVSIDGRFGILHYYCVFCLSSFISKKITSFWLSSVSCSWDVGVGRLVQECVKLALYSKFIQQ